MIRTDARSPNRYSIISDNPFQINHHGSRAEKLQGFDKGYIYEDRDLRPPANLNLILDGLNETVSSVALKICQDAATSEKNNFKSNFSWQNSRTIFMQFLR